MFGRINLDLGTMREATLIPAGRTWFIAAHSRACMFWRAKTETGRCSEPIETGMTREDEVEVLANLDPGTKIVGRGATMLRDGDRISVAGAPGTSVRRKAAVQADGDGAAKKGRKEELVESGASACSPEIKA